MEAPLPIAFPETLFIPETLDCTFAGFGEDAFAILDRLKAHPHIDQYRQEKPAIAQQLTGPFKQYRNDLVVNLVLPNRLPWETERNVFSRLLKNDFGAGGCHHHLWMSFYRPGTKRVQDLQLAHSISPDGFTVGLYAGDHMRQVMPQVQHQITAQPEAFRTHLATLLPTFEVRYYLGTGKKRTRHPISTPDAFHPDDLAKATGLWVRHTFPRADVIRWQADLLHRSLAAVQVLWPLYRFLL